MHCGHINERGEWRETGRKICPCCKIDKSIDEFSIRKSGPREGHPSGHCMDCMVGANRRRRAKLDDPYEIERPDKLRRMYGITVEDYDEMLAEQDGKCAICGSTDSHSKRKANGNSGRMMVDHCHETGIVRGLL